jgi:DNA topoisomerase-3
VFDAGMNYICENATGPQKTCTFRTGKIILQQSIEPDQVKKLLAEGKTDLLKGFISNKNHRKFEARLIVKDGGTAFEFPPREKKGKAKDGAPKEPAAKVDFKGKEVVGKCPKCAGKVYDTEAGYLCERSQLDLKPCKFKIDREKAGRRIEPAEVTQLIAEGRTDLLDKFISKTGKPFSAHLVMDTKGKVTFEFPPRDEGGGGT